MYLDVFKYLGFGGGWTRIISLSAEIEVRKPNGILGLRDLDRTLG